MALWRIYLAAWALGVVSMVQDSACIQVMSLCRNHIASSTTAAATTTTTITPTTAEAVNETTTKGKPADRRRKGLDNEDDYDANNNNQYNSVYGDGDDDYKIDGDKHSDNGRDKAGRVILLSYDPAPSSVVAHQERAANTTKTALRTTQQLANARGELKHTTENTSGMTGTVDGDDPERRPVSCHCTVTTASDFTVAVLNWPKAATFLKSHAWRVDLASGCWNQTVNLTNLSGQQVVGGGAAQAGRQCSDGVEILVQGPYDKEAASRKLMLIVHGAGDLEVQCGTESSSNSTKVMSLPEVQVRIRGEVQAEEEGQTGGAGIQNYTDPTVSRDVRAPSSSGLSNTVIYMMVTSFVCLMLLMVIMAIFLLWRAAVKEKDAMYREHQENPIQSKPKPDDHNYEEISEVRAQASKNVLDSVGAENQNFFQELTVELKKRSKGNSCTQSPDVPVDNNYELSNPGLDREYSVPDDDDVFTVEYSVAKDAVGISSRLQLDLPRDANAPCDSQVASYEDLPTNTCGPSAPLRTPTPVAVTRSTPDLLVSDDVDGGCSVPPERSKSASRLSDTACLLSRPKFNLLGSEDSTNTYFELQRSYRSISLDASKLALYDGVLNNSNGSFDTKGWSGEGSHLKVTNDNANQVSSSVSMEQPDPCPTGDDEYHVYEDVKTNKGLETCKSEGPGDGINMNNITENQAIGNGDCHARHDSVTPNDNDNVYDEPNDCTIQIPNGVEDTRAGDFIAIPLSPELRPDAGRGPPPNQIDARDAGNPMGPPPPKPKRTSSQIDPTAQQHMPDARTSVDDDLRVVMIKNDLYKSPQALKHEAVGHEERNDDGNNNNNDDDNNNEKDVPSNAVIGIHSGDSSTLTEGNCVAEAESKIEDHGNNVDFVGYISDTTVMIDNIIYQPTPRIDSLV